MIPKEEKRQKQTKWTGWILGQESPIKLIELTQIAGITVRWTQNKKAPIDLGYLFTTEQYISKSKAKEKQTREKYNNNNVPDLRADHQLGLREVSCKTREGT